MFRQGLIAVCVAGLCAKVAFGTVPTPAPYPGFNFTYHSYSNLFLTEYHDDCYYTFVESGLDSFMTGQYKESVQMQLMRAVQLRDPTKVFPSSLTEVRELFQDALADYRCANKHIYRLLLDTSGQYLYLERDLDQPGQPAVAELISPGLTLTDSVCFKFQYYLAGPPDLGALAVFAKIDKDGVIREEKLWELSGYQGNGWHEATISVHPQAEAGWTTHLIIRATKGHNDADIRVTNFTSSTGLCLASHLDCTFENGMCEWSQSYRDQSDWTHHKGPTPTTNTGPDHDHTLKNGAGYYMYFESNGVGIGDTADLVSTRLELNSPICLKFYYFMYGSDVGSLSVWAKALSTGQQINMWERRGDQGQQWLQAVVGIIPPVPGDRTQVIIRATRGASIEADIAIDDLAGSTGSCIAGT